MIWVSWISIVWQLRSAFSNIITFFWFVIILMGFTTRRDHNGITSIVRGLSLRGKSYQSLIDFFHSKAINLDTLTKCWVQLVFKIFLSRLATSNGLPVFLLDGIKAPKEGRRMPGVKRLHQSSQNNSKPEYIWGHSCQAVSLLVESGISHIAVPIILRIQEGLAKSNKSTLDKAIDLIKLSGYENGAYLIADAYYFCKDFAAQLLVRGIFLITRVKKSAVAYKIITEKNVKRNKGRPAKYGEKIKLVNLFNTEKFHKERVFLYGKIEEIETMSTKLQSKTHGTLFRYVFIKMSNGNQIILATTDNTLSNQEIIEMYGLRYKIEYSFKEFVHRIGGFAYRFWSKRVSKSRKLVTEKRDPIKENCYQLYLQMCVITQGLIQFISIKHSEAIWKSCGTWIRTIRPGVIPSESIVMLAMENLLNGFLTSLSKYQSYRKFSEFIEMKIVKDRDVFFQQTG